MTPFQKFIQELPYGKFRHFQHKLMMELLDADIYISDQTFRNWANGKCEPTDDAKREIINRCAELIAGKSIY